MLVNNKGFTFLEMIIVILIISIVLGISLLNINKYYARTQLHQISKTIMSKYELAKTLSQTKHQRCLVNINQSSVDIECDGAKVSQAKFNHDVELKTNFNNNTIRINPKGHVEKGGSIDLTLQGEKQTVKIGIGRSDVRIE